MMTNIIESNLVQANAGGSSNNLLNKNILPDRFNTISEPVAGGIVNLGAEVSRPSNIHTVTTLADDDQHK